jgi:hypothetical protein
MINYPVNTLYKNVSLAVFGSNGNSYTISTQSDMYIYTFCSQYRDGNWAREIKKIGTAVSAVCHGNLSTCHFGHMCYRFLSLVTGFLHLDEKVTLHLNL